MSRYSPKAIERMKKIASSRCEMRPGIGLCDKCSKPKWPQEDMGYGITLCLDCLDAERKAQNVKISDGSGQ